MSGIEVVGVVLAVFPIAVNGLQCFTEGVATIKQWKRYRHELANYDRTLQTQRMVFLNTIENLLAGIIESDDGLKALEKDPKGAFSFDPQCEAALQNRLGRSYDIYLLIMDKFHETLVMIQEELGIGDDGKDLWDDYSSLERQVKKLKLALSKKAYTDLLAQIIQANRELKEITYESHVLEKARSKRRTHRQRLDYRTIRRYARSLYNVLVVGNSWVCSCRRSHIASLRLEPRPWERDNNRTSSRDVPSLKFQVLLAKEARDEDGRVSWMYKQLEVKPIETSDATVDLAALSIVHTSSSLVKRKKVNFADPSPDLRPDTTWLSTALAPSATGLEQITDICRAMTGTGCVNREIGFLKDESINQCRHEVYLISEESRLHKDSKSLDYVLDVSRQQKSGFGLSRRDRLYIAVVLASSVLQLDGTSWLKRRWKSGDILFLPRDNQKPNTALLDYSHPYVSWKPFPNDKDTHTVAEPDQAHPSVHIRNDFLFALGIC